MTIGFPLIEHPHLVHAVFEALALGVGALYYRILWRRLNPGVTSPLRKDHFPVLLGCILGAALGNKVVFWIEVPHLLSQYWQTPTLWLGGQSIVGGLLGGLIGVELAKKWAGIQRSTGDTFVFSMKINMQISVLKKCCDTIKDGVQETAGS